MGLFHCPMGSPFYDDEPCIDCGLCSATTKEAKIEASKKIRVYLRSGMERKGTISKIVVTGKGGVGKSSVVALMAKSLQKKGYSVSVLDADESNPGLHRMFGFNEEPKPLMAMLDGSSSSRTEAETEWAKREQITIQDIPPEYILSSNGLTFTMVGKIIDPFQGCACLMASVVGNFVAKLRLKDKGVILVDTEAGVESFGRGLERNADTVLIVVEPSYQSIVLAEKICYMAEGMGITRVRAILNRVSSEEIGQKVMEELAGKNIKTLGTLYFDPHINEAGFLGKALGDSWAAADMDTIAGIMLAEAK